MGKINLFDIGLSEQYVQEDAVYGDDLHLARVSAQHREIYRVITENGEMRAVVSGRLSYAASAAADYPVVGDWVLVDRGDDRSGSAIIKHILTRKSCFERKAAGKGYERQVIAANIDTVFICMSLNKDYNLRRAERYLSIAWDSGAVPVFVLTKADLSEDTEAKLAELQSVAFGADVVVTSSMSADGYDSITKYLQRGKTIAFIGSSGVGKSTLINDCYFRDCRHESEPKCAVRKAIEDGLLPLKRFENYKKLQNEMVFVERKSTMTAAQSEKQKIIGMMGSLDARKQLSKNKPKDKR